MAEIDKLCNKPQIYNKLVSYLSDEHYDIHKLLATIKNKKYLRSTIYALLHSADCYVMYSQEILIGVCAMIYGNIASIYIFPEHRHKGYARIFLKYIENICKGIIIWTYNAKYIPYYESLGYTLKEIIQDNNSITYILSKNKAKL
jgi:GNAT superfamily N-acetyltransferase